MTDSGKAEYSFTDSEIKKLALLLRRQGSSLDSGLDGFRCFLEGSIYYIMTIEEAEVFFDEK
jgi:hypothetical protein